MEKNNHRWREGTILARHGGEAGEEFELQLDPAGTTRQPAARVLPFSDAGGVGALLREAAVVGSDEVVEGLCDIAGVCVREADGEATTALHEATRCGHKRVVDALIARYSEADGQVAMRFTCNRSARRPLDNLFGYQHSALLRSTKPSEADKDFGNSKLYDARLRRERERKREERDGRAVRRGSVASEGSFSILEAVALSDTAQLLSAVEVAPVGQIDRREEGSSLTPLMLASRCDDAQNKLLILLRVKADISLTSTRGCTSLLIAAEAGKAEAVALLCHYGSDCNRPDVSGNSPLHHAAFNGHTEAARQLLYYKV